jgi:hypothetical protein
MTESALFYTFSTIPQTLAGGAAILVAVVLYRLGDVDRTIDHAREHLQAAWRERPFRIAWRALERGGWRAVEGVVARWEGFVSTFEDQNAGRRAYRALRLRQQILFLLVASLTLTALDILVCFASIPLTPRLLRAQADAAQVVVGTLTLTCLCLGFYARLIWAMVQPIRS